MALQHSAALDPSVAMSYNAEEKRKRRNSLLAEHRLGRKTEVVDVETAESVGRTVHRQIEARAGSRRVGVVEIEPSPRTEVRSLEDGARGSIPYHSQVGASPSRSPTPYIGSVSRSQSSVEVWRVGIPRSRRPSIRAMSTRSSTIALQDMDVNEEVSVLSRDHAPPSIRVLGQPNRVLMDLAGVDLPGRPAASTPRMLVRRNSTATIQQTPVDIGTQIHQAASKASQEVSSAEVDETDRAFYNTLFSAFKQTTDHQFIYGLVRLYRIPRANSSELQVQSLKMGVEAPLGYSTASYNLCLDALLRVRRSGQSIQPFLEIYNEMLANDCLPNLRTYSAIIRCLTAREEDVWASVTEYEEKKKWQRYRAEIFGREYDLAIEAERDAIHEGYKQEGNFESAIRMFRASTLHRSTEGLAAPMKAILEVAVKRENSELDFAAAMEVYEAGVASQVPGWKSWKGYQLELLGKRGDRAALEKEWEAFYDEWKTAESRSARDWLSSDVQDETTRMKRLEDVQRRTWMRAAKAFLYVGDVDKALQIWSKVDGSRRHKERTIASPPKPSVACDVEFGLQLTKTDPHKGMKYLNDAVFKHGHMAEPSVYRQILRTLISGDQLDIIRDRCCTEKFRQAAMIDLGTFQDLYAYCLDKARTDPTAASRALWILRQWTQSKAMLIDMAIIRAHAEVIALNRDWANFPRILHAFKHFHSPVGRNSEDAKAELFAWARDVLCEWPIDFVAAARLVNDVQKLMDLPQDDTLAIAMARKYFDHRVRVLSWQDQKAAKESRVEEAEDAKATVLEGEGEGEGEHGTSAASSTSTATSATTQDPGVSHLNLQLLLRLMSEYQAEDGELDDVFVLVANDMASMAKQSPDFILKLADTLAMRHFVQKLAYRVGEERAKELVLPILGEFMASSWTTLPKTAPVVPPAPATPELSQGETTSEAGASLASAETPASGVDFSAQFGSGLKLSVGLGNDINRHTYRNAQLTALEAYALLKKRMATTGEVAPPEMLGRLLDNLSRTNEEDKVREVYALAQHVIHTLIAPHERLAEWADVENRMLIAACHLGHLEEAGTCRARLLEAGQRPSADSYATMIASAKDTTDETHVARAMFDEARAMGVTPNLFLYNTIISKLSRARKADEALELFKAMKLQGIRPSSVTYGAVIVSIALAWLDPEVHLS
jgi:pentatricopeptide repeat protein